MVGCFRSLGEAALSSVWIHDIVERHHDVMNPCSVDKVRLVGQRMGLDRGASVLDLGAGTAGPAVLFADSFGCRVTAIENHERFVTAGKKCAATRGVSDLVSYVLKDGAAYDLGRERYDAALCLGATWILGGFAKTARRLREVVREGGHVAIGDVFRKPGISPAYDVDLTLEGLIESMRSEGLRPITVVVASEDDWTDYVSRQLLALADWLDDNPAHPEAKSLADLSSQWYGDRAEWRTLGWAIVVGRRRR